MNKLLTTITLLCFSVAAHAHKRKSSLYTQKDSENFVFEVNKGVKED